jgi:hypothetical protein
MRGRQSNPGTLQKLPSTVMRQDALCSVGMSTHRAPKRCWSSARTSSKCMWLYDLHAALAVVMTFMPEFQQLCVTTSLLPYGL